MSKSVEVIDPYHTPQNIGSPVSRWERYGFVLPIILGLGVLVTLGLGLAGYLNGACHLNQINSIIILSSGAGVAALALLSYGAIGACKKSQVISRNDTLVDSQKLMPFQNDAIIDSGTSEQITLSDLRQAYPKLKIYGAEAWEKIGLKNIGKLPPLPKEIINELEATPSFGASKVHESFTLLLIPKSLQISGLITVAGDNNLPLMISDQFARYENNEVSNSYWLLISNSMVESLIGGEYQSQVETFAKSAFTFPHVWEIFSYLILAFLIDLQKPLKGQKSYCAFHVGEKKLLCGHSPDGLKGMMYQQGGQDAGAFAVKRFTEAKYIMQTCKK